MAPTGAATTSKAFAFLWTHGKAEKHGKDLHNEINFIIKGTYNDDITGTRKFRSRSTKTLGFVKSQKATVNFQPPPPVMPAKKFHIFWIKMKQVEAVTSFLEALLKRLNELDRDDTEGDKLSRSRCSWTFGLIYRSNDRVTICLPGSPAVERAFRLPPTEKDLFISLYHDLNLEKPSIKNLLQMMTESSHGKQHCTWQQTVLHILKLNKKEKRRSLATMVGHCAACISSHISALNNCIIGAGWLYLWLQDCALDGHGAEIIGVLLKCLDLIQKDPSTIVVPSHELQIMCVLYMIRSFLSLTFICETTYSQLINAVKGLMGWPNPVGHHAIETYNAISLEGKAPGYALRHRFMVSDVQFIPKRRKSSEGKESRSIVVNMTCQNGALFQSLLQCDNACQATPDEIIDAKLLISLFILENSGDENMIQDGRNSWIWKLPASIAKILYDALLEVMEDASNSKQMKDAVDIRKIRIGEIWRDLEQTYILGQLPPLVPERKLPSIEFLTKRVQDISFVFVTPELKWRPVSTKVVEVHAQPGPMLARYCKTGAEDLLMDIIAKKEQNGKSDSTHLVKEVVQLLLGGGDGTLHYILAGYVSLTYSGKLAGGMKMSNAASSIDILFYLIPLGQNNTLPTYIAQRDLWYDATLYRPLIDQLPMVPHISQSKADEAQFDITSTPTKLLTRQIQNYLIDAACILKLSIYNCEGWYHNGNQSYHCTIPFLLRAEMGIPAASVSEHKEMNSPHQESIPRRPLDPLNEDSLAQFASVYSLRAKVIFRPIDWEGKEGEEKINVCSFTAIQAINVPKPCDSRLGRDPRSRFLDVCLMDAAMANKIKHLDEIVNWVSAYKVTWVIVEAQDASQPFDILLDGELYGPFYRVRLSSCPHPSNRRFVLKFPVVTYWPTHISRTSF